jgi:hypothetical protein
VSYARFGWDGSDVYVYLDVAGSICCCACRLNEPEQWKDGDPLFPPSEYLLSTDDAIEHLRRHTEAGHTVPDTAVPNLIADRDENDAFIAAGGRS